MGILDILEMRCSEREGADQRTALLNCAAEVNI